MVRAPEAEGYEINSVPFRTKALPPSITLKAPFPVRLNAVRLAQPEKAELPMSAAPAGKETLTRLAHSEKA